MPAASNLEFCRLKVVGWPIVERVPLLAVGQRVEVVDLGVIRVSAQELLVALVACLIADNGDRPLPVWMGIEDVRVIASDDLLNRPSLLTGPAPVLARFIGGPHSHDVSFAVMSILRRLGAPHAEDPILVDAGWALDTTRDVLPAHLLVAQG